MAHPDRLRTVPRQPPGDRRDHPPGRHADRGQAVHDLRLAAAPDAIDLACHPDDCDAVYESWARREGLGDHERLGPKGFGTDSRLTQRPIAAARRRAQRAASSLRQRAGSKASGGLCGGYASAIGGQRRTVAARGGWLPDLSLARLRIREVQALEVVGIGDRDLEPRRVGVDELAGGKEQAELLLPRRAPGEAWIREPALRVA